MVIVEVIVFEFLVWVFLGIENFVEIEIFKFVVFEFGEDLFFEFMEIIDWNWLVKLNVNS